MTANVRGVAGDHRVSGIRATLDPPGFRTAVSRQGAVCPAERAVAASLHEASGKERIVEITATVTSKGQVTIPKQVRDALGIEEGDRATRWCFESRVTGRHSPERLTCWSLRAVCRPA
jgi:Antidote-toxin recognition MazE, bacterial antitoxin